MHDVDSIVMMLRLSLGSHCLDRSVGAHRGTVGRERHRRAFTSRLDENMRSLVRAGKRRGGG